MFGLKRRKGNAGERTDEDNASNFGAARLSDEQRARHTVWGFPAVLGYVDMHQRDGFASVVSGALGSRYQLVQMLSMRDPVDTRWLNDSLQTPTWLRTVPSVRERQRMGLAVQPAISPYNVQEWQATTYAGIPAIGRGPASIFVVPASQISD